MKRQILISIISVVSAILFISGCSTVPKKVKEELSGIKSKVETLETRVEGVESKQQDVERATSEQSQTIQELMQTARAKVARTNITTRPRPSGRKKEHVREIQTCLKNAGFYGGKIDGIRGRGTVRAIKSFQKVHGLRPDGIVGKMTWEVLSKYASGPAKSADDTSEGSTK